MQQRSYKQTYSYVQTKTKAKTNCLSALPQSLLAQGFVHFNFVTFAICPRAQATLHTYIPVLTYTDYKKCRKQKTCSCKQNCTNFKCNM